jgi:hypothetical protein
MILYINAEEIATFTSFEQWVNKASSWLCHSKRSHQLICLDRAGNLCQLGEDFMASRDHGLFPVKAYLLEKSVFAVNNYSPQTPPNEQQ